MAKDADKLGYWVAGRPLTGNHYRRSCAGSRLEEPPRLASLSNAKGVNFFVSAIDLTKPCTLRDTQLGECVHIGQRQSRAAVLGEARLHDAEESSPKGIVGFRQKLVVPRKKGPEPCYRSDKQTDGVGESDTEEPSCRRQWKCLDVRGRKGQYAPVGVEPLNIVTGLVVPRLSPMPDVVDFTFEGRE